MKTAIHLPHIGPWLRMLFVCVCALGVALMLPQQAAATYATLTVNTGADGNTRDAYLSLREAIAIANHGTGGSDGLGRSMTNGEIAQAVGCGVTGDNGGHPEDPAAGNWTITGGCGAGPLENIRFAPSITQITISVGQSLSLNDAGTWIDGNGPGTPRIDASGITNYTFQIHASHVTISNLSIVNGQPLSGADIAIDAGIDSRIAYNYLGTVPGATNCAPSGVTRTAWSGILVFENHAGGIAPYGAPVYIYGNVIGCHPAHGIDILNSDYAAVGVDPDGTTPDGNWIGLNQANVALPNILNGVYISGLDSLDTASYNTIANNVISGNGGSGIVIRQAAVTSIVRGNKIGTNSAGTAALANGGHGVEIGDGAARYNLIGGPTAADRNIIGGNAQNGVYIHNGPTNNLIANNLIGIRETGGAIPNGLAGVAIVGANTNDVGVDSTEVATTQFISGNSREGVYIAYSSGNQILQSTFIGVTPDLMPQGNGREGILLDVGTIYAVVAPTVVACNGLATGLPGIAVKDGSTGSWIKPYHVVGNGGLPIDLGEDGPTPNGAHSGAGPNNWMNYPTITSVSGSTITLHACADCDVRIYDAIGNPGAAGGGGSFLGSVTTDTSGNSTVDLSTFVNWSPAKGLTLVAYKGHDGSSEMSPRLPIYVPLIRK